MEYILYSTMVKLRKGREIMVPPISMYHMKKLLELKEQGVNLDDPNSSDLSKILSLIGEVIRENHPDLTDEELVKEVDARALQEIMVAIQNLPKNSTAQTGTQVVPEMSDQNKS